jgi:glycosyltransferase involved in cell wall biosynthesis
MVIVHVVEPFATGINTFLQELVFSMPNHEHVIIHGERKDCRSIDKIKLEYKEKASFVKWNCAKREIDPVQDLKAFFELKKILKCYDYDILHLHSSKAGVLGQFIRRNNNRNTVVYTPNAASFLRTDISNRKRILYRWIEKTIHKNNTVIVSSCNSELEAYGKLGVKTRKIKNGVTISSSKNSFEKGKSVFNIVFCGKITIQKNPRLFNEIANYYKEDSTISFTWIGDGELRNVLTSKNIHVTGWCSKSEVYESLAKADIYLSASSWEGLSLATIEALSFGLPLVLNRCVGNQDIVTSGVNGFLFETKEKAIDYIEFLRAHSKKLKQLSENSVQIYQRHYNSFRCGLEYEQLYIALNRMKEKSKSRKKRIQ